MLDQMNGVFKSMSSSSQCKMP